MRSLLWDVGSFAGVLVEDNELLETAAFCENHSEFPTNEGKQMEIRLREPPHPGRGQNLFSFREDQTG